MSECVPCKQLARCLQFGDFNVVEGTDTLYLNQPQSLVVTCDDGSTVTVQVPGGVIGFVLKFQLGNPPYPDLMLDCSGTLYSVSVPDDCTQVQLNGLITGILTQCAQQLAKQVGCEPAQFFNTVVSFSPCGGAVRTPGAIAAGLTVTAHGVSVAAGTVSSSISQNDANAKAVQLAQEAFFTGNLACSA